MPNLQEVDTALVHGGLSPASAATLTQAIEATVSEALQEVSPWEPTAQGFSAWSYDPAYTAATNQAPTAGVEYLVKVQATTTGPVTKVYFDGTNTPGTLADVYVGVRDTSGDLLAKSANLATALNGAGSALRSGTLTSTLDVVAGVDYYVAFVVGSATTMIQMSRAAAPGNLGNAGLDAATLRYAVNGTGKTDLAASITMGDNTAGLALWFALGN